MSIVAAVGTATAKGRHGSLAKRFEQAQAEAIRDALARGVSLEDHDAIILLKEQARRAVKEEDKV